MSNPFRYTVPVEAKSFVGRWPLVKSIASDLTQVDGDSYAIIAGRRCGKSSLLNAIAHQLCQPETTDAGDFTVIPISFDFKILAEDIESADVIYAYILKEIYSSLDANSSYRPKNAWAQPVQLNEEHFLELTKQSAISLRDFQEGIGHILKQHDAATQHIRLVLLLDEIDNVIDRPWTPVLFGQLRSIIYSSNIRSRVRLLVTGSHLLEEVGMHGSPLWNVLKIIYLEPFDEKGFKELIGRVEGLPEDAAGAIWLQCGGHPFIAQYLLHYLWNQGIHQVTKSNVEVVAGKFLAERANDIKGWARAIDLGGLEAYRILSTIDGWVEEREIVRAVNNPSLDVKLGLIALSYHGFVLHDSGWTKYRYFGEIFKKWYDTNGTTIALEPTSFVKPGAAIGEHIQATIIVKEGEIITGDKYEVSGQVGAMGQNAHAHDMNWIQLWQQLAKEIDMLKLADELKTLRSKMHQEGIASGTTAEQDLAIGEVANAQIAAEKGDGSRALEHLRAAGKWALSCAEKISVPVAVAAIKAAMGL